jgi:hypothetical protein
LGIEAGTGFDPFFGFYLAVVVQVGTEVAMTAEAGTGIIFQQQQDEDSQRVLLKGSTRIGRTAVFVQATFITDTD